METPTHCTLCPRRCGADRTRTHGLCGGGGMVKIARAALHFWEEPCISGTQGSGTVFFSQRSPDGVTRGIWENCWVLVGG